MKRWPLLLLAMPAAVATWSGWVGLGEMTGFGVVQLLPGIADLEINTAITLPIGVEAYAAYALHAWLTSSDVAPGTRRFAKWSALGSLMLGMLGQVAFHLLEVAGHETAPTGVVVAVSCLPVLVLGMGAGLGHMLSRDAQARNEVEAETTTPVVDSPMGEKDPLPALNHQVHAPAVSPQVVRLPGGGNPDELGGDSPPNPAVPEPVPDVEVRPGPVPGPDPDEAYRPVAVATFLAEVTQGEVPPVRTIRERLNISTDRAGRLRRYLHQLVTEAAR